MSRSIYRKVTILIHPCEKLSNVLKTICGTAEDAEWRTEETKWELGGVD